MDIQLKKGFLELAILRNLRCNDSYGYQIINDMAPFVVISESTLYAILRRLEDQGSLDTYKVEHEGRLRKYYKITRQGRKRLKEFRGEFRKMMPVIKYILGENNG